MRRSARAAFIGFCVSFLLGFTAPSTPTRATTSQVDISKDAIVVSTGVPSAQIAKDVSACTNTQPLAYDNSTHAFVCLTAPGTDPLTITSASSGFGAGTLLATGVVFGGHKLTQAATISNVSIYVSVASSSTAATDVITITDGTNTCTATFNCTGTMDSAGAKNVATANGAGTGCVYATNASITYSATTQGCVTPPTVKNIDIIGNFP